MGLPLLPVIALVMSCFGVGLSLGLGVGNSQRRVRERREQRERDALSQEQVEQARQDLSELIANQEAAANAARNLAREISGISRFRRELQLRCGREEPNATAIGTGVFKLWTTHSGGDPDFEVVFADDNSWFEVLSVRGHISVVLRDEELRRVRRKLETDGFGRCLAG